MNEEEKRTVNFVKKYLDDDEMIYQITNEDIVVLLNLIDKQQKEIDEQNKVIDEMARTILEERGYRNIDEHPEWIKNTKRFFFKKVENDERREKFLRKVEENE